MRRVPRAPCPRFKPQAVPSLKQSTQPCSSEAALLPRSLGAESAPRMRAPLPAPSAPRSLVAKVQAWQRCKNGGPPHRSAAPRGQQPTASRRAPARRARRTARDQPPARGRRSAHLNRGAVVVHELAITAEATPLLCNAMWASQTGMNVLPPDGDTAALLWRNRTTRSSAARVRLGSQRVGWGDGTEAVRCGSETRHREKVKGPQGGANRWARLLQ